MQTDANRRVMARAGMAACALIVLAAGCAAPPPPPAAAPRAAAPAARAPMARPAVPPRVMLLIDEKNLGTVATSEVEALAAAALREQNVPVVDQDMVRSNIKRDQQILKMAGDNRGAATVGLQYGAEVIVVGEAVAKPSARRIAESNLRTYQAVVTLRAVRTDTSETIASASESESVIGLDDAVGGSQALRGAALRSLDALLPQILDAWARSGGARGSRLTLTIGGVDQMWKLKALRDSLRGRPGAVAGVVQRSYTAGSAVFEVETRMPVEALAEALVLEPPEGLRLQVLDTGAGRIELRAMAVGTP
jgi:hypothetical protein